MTGSLTYTYAVARDDGSLGKAVSELVGVAGATVDLVRAEACDDLVAAVSQVPEQDFDEAVLRVRLEDLDWLESTARAHHRVVDALAARTTVLPLRLVTMYRDDERVRAMLRTRCGAFTARLEDLAAQVEWGVKIYVEEPAADAPADPDPGAGLSPGRAYLSHRRAQRHAREDAYRHADEAAGRVESAASAYAVDRVRHRAQQGGLASEQGENLVNDAYLVPLRHAEDFRADVAQAANGLPGVRVEVTGPWAPYSFAAPAAPEPPGRSVS
ncbi:GvpL/GvpF family gas vesicle protein [Streptomyces sp. NPDC020403]|uniref:GvpL/GvpF family gas vesicle protein n=1 Tax=unclassified Streptomyces TaxID=2593676 RepID=UPI0033D897E3